MKKIMILLGLTLAGLTACQEEAGIDPTDTVTPAAATGEPAVSENGKSVSALMWHGIKDGANQVWRFHGDAAPLPTALWATDAEWQPLAFVAKGWGGLDMAVWRSTASSEVRLWKVLDTEEPFAEVLPPAAANWRIAAVLDVDADSFADLVWTGPEGEVAVWTLREGKVVAQAVIGDTGGDWTLAQVGDFDGDGRGDLFWRKNDRTSASVWMLDGLAIKERRGMADAGDQWSVLAAGRFDRKSGADLLWRDTAGDLAIWSGADSAHGSSLSRQVPSGWMFLGALDTDGNGQDDLLWSNPDTRQFGAWLLAADGAIADRSLPPVGGEWAAVPSALVVHEAADSP
jgi:FG-GAP-like repeat